ncbi:MAG: Rqc2 family fibronectin-binding protein [Culicoidibacterales bacterium]
MRFDGLFIEALLNELKPTLDMSRIQKIQQPTQHEFLFTIRNNGKNQKLLISIHPETSRFHITTQTYESNQIPPRFCLLMRKLFEGGIIEAVTHHHMDRIVEFIIKKRNDIGDMQTFHMYVFFRERRSNIVITDQDQLIIDATTHTDMTAAFPIMPRIPLTLEPARGIPYTTAQSLEETINGLSSFSSQLLSSATNWKDCLSTSISTPHPQRFTFKGKSAFSFLNINIDEAVQFDSLSYLLDDFYFKKDLDSRLSQVTQNITKKVSDQLKKQQKKLSKLSQSLHESENNDQLKHYGDLIFTSLYNNTYQPGDTSITLDDYLSQTPIQIPLDTRLSLIDNANRYYKKHQKLRKAKIHLLEQIEYTEVEIDYFSQLLFQLENVSSILDAEEIKAELITKNIIRDTNNRKVSSKKKKSIENFHTIQLDDATIFIGKTNIQNAHITFQVASSQDLWFHVRNVPGSHVILKGEHSDTNIELAALFAAHFSKLSGSAKIPIDYTSRKYVKKITGGPAGFVHYDNFKTITIDDDADKITSYLKGE